MRSLPSVSLLLALIASLASSQPSLSVSAGDWVSAMTKAASSLNVAPPSTWSALMNPPTTTGTYGSAQVGTSSYQSVMSAWPIPAEFRSQAETSVGLLVAAATEGEYIAQSYVFNANAGQGSLTTLIVVATRLSSPPNAAAPVQVGYYLLTSSCSLKQQYSVVVTRQCKHCSRCLWMRKCCCTNVSHQVARGDTAAELLVIEQRLEQDQYGYFTSHLPATAILEEETGETSLPDATIGSEDAALVVSLAPSDSLLTAINNYLDRSSVEEEVTADYTDPVLVELQRNLTSLAQRSSALNMQEVADSDVPKVEASVATLYGFLDFIKPFLASDAQAARFSHEVLVSAGSAVQYCWLMGESSPAHAGHHDLYFVSVKLWANFTQTNQSGHSDGGETRVLRSAQLLNNGEFENSVVEAPHSPWPANTTVVVLDLLRYIAASALLKRPPSLDVIAAAARRDLVNRFGLRPVSSSSKVTSDQVAIVPVIPVIIGLADAVKAVISVWSSIASAFKTVKSVTVQRVIRLGFQYFHELTTVLKAEGVAQEYVPQFINTLVTSYNLPTQQGAPLLYMALEYATNVTWSRDDTLWSPTNAGTYTSMLLFKNGDPTTNSASFFVVDIQADCQLAPDLLIVETHKSVLGGIFESDTVKIETVPHMLSLNDALQLQQFFQIVAMGKMAEVLGIPYTYPTLD